MSKYKIILSLVMVAMIADLMAQTHKCGVTTSMGAMIQEQLIQNRNEMRDYVQERAATVYLPVRFLLVARSNGTDRTRETVCLDALCNLNNNFADQDIQFYLLEFKDVNNTALYENAMSNGAYSILNNNMTYNAINIFMVDDAGGGAAAFYQPPAGQFGDDWIVCSENYGDDFETLTHEMGHFFSLNHPFYGWEQTDNGWDPSIHGNPVGIWSPATNPSILNERVDGSNCNNAGDMICDTPADYLFPFPGPNGCTYNLNAKDPSGALLQPDMTNFMNYASCSNDLYHFTPMQKDEIQNSLNSSSRNYIPKGYTPDISPITQTPTLVKPAQLQKIETYNTVYLEWTEVQHADAYLVEIVNQTTGTQIFETDQTSITVTTLIPDETFFWKVHPFSEYYTCASPSVQGIFRTGDIVNDTNEISALDDWGINPNPVRIGDQIFVNVESSTGLVMDVRLSTVTGQTIQLFKDQYFADGLTAFGIETFNLPAGVYLVSLQTSEGVETKRVSIL